MKIVLVVVLVVLAGAAGYFLFPMLNRPPGGEAGGVQPPKPAPAPAPAPAPGQPVPTAKNVRFGFTVTGVTGSGLSRTVTAQLSNGGTDDAHNVWARLEVFSQGSRIKLGGQDSLRVDIGTLRAGSSVVTKQATLEFGLLDGVKLAQGGAQITLTIYSDEKTETLTYDYRP